MQYDLVSAEQPPHLPIKLKGASRLRLSLQKAKKTIEQFNAFVAKCPFIHSFDQLMVIREAIDSLDSQHIHAHFEEILLTKLMGGRTATRRPVLDYLNAFEHAVATIRDQPPSHSFFYSLHAAVKGLLKRKRAYRSQQNWIGPEGQSKEKAYFFPPPPEAVYPSMTHLIQYWKRKEKEPLIQLAVIFAQLLIIHPFMDGNGRMARLLVPLFLLQKNLIAEPIFFLSHFLKQNRLAYFQNLFSITFENRWDKWIQFFLKGLSQQGIKDLKDLKKIAALYRSLFEKLLSKWPRKKTEQILLFLFQHPLCMAIIYREQLGSTRQESEEMIRSLLHHQILKRVRRRGQTLFSFPALLSLLDPKKNLERHESSFRGR